MIPYILHVSILIAAGVLFYILALKRLTFYVLNRWVLLSCLAAAFLLPLMPVPRALSWKLHEKAASGKANIVKTSAAGVKAVIYEKPVVRTKVADRLEKTAPSKDFYREPTTSVTPDAIAAASVPVAPVATASVQADGRGVDILKILFYLYLSGVIILGFNLLRQMTLLMLQRYRGPVIRDGHYRIVTTAGMQGPCSFGNIIFIHPAEYDPTTYQQILLHEKIHAGGWHTLDILLAELGIVFQWFNPFIWLYRREMENNLEFLTDRNVLRHAGVERAAYQLSLVKVAAPDVSFNITSNYNQSLLKRRIIMMNAQHSSRHTAWKYFFLLPIFILLAGLLNHPAAMAQAVRERPSSPAKPSRPAAEARLSIPSVPVISVTIGEIGSVPTVQPVVQTTIVSSVIPVTDIDVHTDVTPSVNVSVPVAPVIPLTISDTSKPSWGDRSEGAWFIVGDKDNKEDKVTIELRGENDDHTWNSSFSVPRSQLSSLNNVGKVDFTLTREAGTIHFTGQFDGDQGFGHYKYQADAGYLARMRQKKIIGNEDELMSFFILDIKKSYVDMLQANGFPDISKGHLISMAALHIEEDYIKAIRAAGFTDISENQLVTFKALHIDKPYIDELRGAGYDHLDASRLITFKSMKIDGDYLRKFPPSTSPNDIVTYKSLHIDSAYVASLKKAGYPDLSSREIVTLKSMKVDADYIKGFNDIGYKDLPAHTLVSFKSMGITPEYIKSFREVGLMDISRESLVSMKSMDITPAFAKGFLDMGYKDITPRHLSSLKAMNITPEFVKSFNAIGFKDIPLNQLSSLKAMGVTAEYVKKMKEKGFISDDLNKYIRLKNTFE